MSISNELLELLGMVYQDEKDKTIPFYKFVETYHENMSKKVGCYRII